MPETAKRTARVPILGEDGRISDDYIPAAIGEGVEAAEAAATRAETAATDAEGSASAASQSATGAQGSASAASTSAAKAQESATAASGAVTQAQSAQKAAEAAKTGAESARDSAKTAASQAQQSATAAAESAGQVADKFIASAQATTLEPGSQATASVADQVLTLGIPRGDKGEKGDKGDKGDPGDVSAVQTAEGSDLSVSTDEGTVTIDDSALRERIAELENQAANVLTGTSTGLVAHAEDAYPQKPREVRIKGETRQNLWVNPSGTSGGVTVTSNEDGSMTLSGTNSTSNDIYILSDVITTIPYGKQLTVSSSNYGESGKWRLVLTGIGGETITGQKTFLAEETPGYTGRVSVVVTPGTTVNATVRVMLNEGSTAQPWCPPGLNSVDELSIVTAGKNLANAENVVIGNGGTVTDNDNSDGSFDFNVTSEGVYAFVREKVTLTPGTYRFSAQLSGSGSAQVILNDGFVADTNDSFTVNSTNEYELRVTQNSSIQGTVHVSGWQLELGSTATAYEPPTVTTTPLPEVELRSLPNGTCDELVIKADGTCEVERRTQLVDGEVVALDSPITEPQSPVSLPQLPAPTFNAWHDSDVPSDTTVTYERDINIVLDNLAKQVAGTASAVAVREASTIEEE